MAQVYLTPNAGHLVTRRRPRDALPVPDADIPDLDALLLRLGQGTPESREAERALAEAGDAALERILGLFDGSVGLAFPEGVAYRDLSEALVATLTAAARGREDVLFAAAAASPTLARHLSLFTVFRALRDPRAIPLLRTALGDRQGATSWVRRWSAIPALAACAGADATGDLVALLEDPDDTVRFAAVGALGEVGDTRALDPLRAVAEHPRAGSGPGFAPAARAAVAAIEGRALGPR